MTSLPQHQVKLWEAERLEREASHKVLECLMNLWSARRGSIEDAEIAEKELSQAKLRLEDAQIELANVIFWNKE